MIALNQFYMYVIYPLQPGYKTGLSASYLQNRFDGFIIYFPQENHPASMTMAWIVFGLSGLPMNGISCNNKEIIEAEKRWAYCQISMNLVIMGLQFWRLSGVRVLNFPLQQHEHEHVSFIEYIVLCENHNLASCCPNTIIS